MAQLAARIFDSPLALVSVGAAGSGEPGSGNAATSPLTQLFAFASCEERLAQMPVSAQNKQPLIDPLAAADSGFGFFAGAPLRAADGHRLGVLAVLDCAPRELSDQQIAALKRLAEIAVDVLAAPDTGRMPGTDAV